jgi:hypothetical protein
LALIIIVTITLKRLAIINASSDSRSKFRITPEKLCTFFRRRICLIHTFLFRQDLLNIIIQVKFECFSVLLHFLPPSVMSKSFEYSP